MPFRFMVPVCANFQKFAAVAAALGLALASSQAAGAQAQVHTGICDASAAAPLGASLFAAASDEDNTIRVYQRDRGGPPTQTFNLSGSLELDWSAPEADIEGAARLGDRVYWITSHGRNDDGKVRPNRSRFFATRFEVRTNRVILEVVGRPYKDLVRDLISAPNLKRFDFAGAARRAPNDKGGLNIEGLCATPGNHLLIGFRNPIPGKQALILPLQNPEKIVVGEPARFGDPILLDLGGLGIRDMTFADGKYLIAAGSHDGGGASKLFIWDGKASKPGAVKGIDLRGFNPEAVVIYPETGFREAQILSDDSSRKLGGTRCKDLRGDARSFRAIWVAL